MFGVCHFGDMRCSGFQECAMFGMWDVWEVMLSGCGMFEMSDVWDAGCSGCGMFGM